MSYYSGYYKAVYTGQYNYAGHVGKKWNREKCFGDSDMALPENIDSFFQHLT